MCLTQDRIRIKHDTATNIKYRIIDASLVLWQADVHKKVKHFWCRALKETLPVKLNLEQKAPAQEVIYESEYGRSMTLRLAAGALHEKQLLLSMHAFSNAALRTLCLRLGVQFENSSEVGVFSKLTNAYCLVDSGGSQNFYSAFEAELVDVIFVIKTSIGSAHIVVRRCIGNKNGLLLPHTTTDQEFHLYPYIWDNLIGFYIICQLIFEEINEKILSLGYGELRAEIISVDSQESYGGGVLVLVTGFMIGEDNIKKKFTQCFFLDPQEKGYFVLNDVFRYVNENGIQGSAQDIGSPVSHDDVADPTVLETQVSEPIPLTAEDGEEEEVYNTENGQVSGEEEEEAPLPVVLDEIPDDSQVVAGLTCQIEDVPKKSYASIVKFMKQIAAPSSTAAAVSVKSAVKSQDQLVTAAHPPSNLSETNGSIIYTNEIGNNQETEGLSPNATPAIVENEFKKFGPIKSGGIQVRTQKGFSFGFVEFEVASTVQSALEILISLLE
ncbi:hypothetical protein RIF29_38312 [Crotalaria pallida]|uniref:NTF2 domain-containing protein n=1 Tax=Crotalaria pallida TaxID=3830 RepID=A0AAN9HS90_CROPI